MPNTIELRTHISPALATFEKRLVEMLAHPLSMTDIDWICELDEQTSELKADRNYCLWSKGIWDFMRDEFYPSLPILKTCFNGPQITFQFHRKEGPIDLTIRGPHFLEEIQITTVQDGQKNRLQNELLVLQGRATATGTISRGSKKKGIIEKRTAALHRDSLTVAGELLENTISRKARQTYAGNVSLLIAFNKWDLHIHSNSDYEFMLATATRKIGNLLQFGQVYLADSAGKPYYVRRLK